MPMYRKKPVVIEARQFDGTNRGELVRWIEASNPARVPDPLGKRFVIPTLEGPMTAATGWWIIKGIAGEFYPCDPEIFKGSYDVVEAVLTSEQ